MPEDQSLPEIQCRFPLKFWWMNHPEPPPSYISVFPEICRGNSELESICSAAAVLIQVRALQNRERFEEVEGLLSTPVLMYDPEAVQDLSGLEEEALKEIAACLVFCINWLRTVISQFGFLCHEDPETTGNLFLFWSSESSQLFFVEDWEISSRFQISSRIFPKEFQFSTR